MNTDGHREKRQGKMGSLGYRFRSFGRTAKNILSKFINFFKRIIEKIYTRGALHCRRKKLKSLHKLRLECFQEMGERVYDLKKDTSLELIDLAAVNEHMEKLRGIDDDIKKERKAIKEIKGGKIEGLLPWWSRRGSNP